MDTPQTTRLTFLAFFLGIALAVTACTRCDIGHKISGGNLRRITQGNAIENPGITPTIPDRPRNRFKGISTDSFYEMFSHQKIPLELDHDVVMERIRKGLDIMVPAEKTPAKQIPTIDDAYQQLIHNYVFIDDLPIWGIDMERYFVFSGFPKDDPKLAFQAGFAVKKEDGRIYRWWHK